jgi:hypothetical protein
MMDSAANNLGGVPRAFFNLLSAQMKLGMDLFESMTGVAVPDLTRSLERTGRHLRGGCCEIPPPCWVPRNLGDCVSHVCPCSTASLRLVIENCDGFAKRTVGVEATGTVKVSPPQIVIGPLEHATIELSISIPADAKAGETLESLVRIHGCREYYFRWKVSVGTLGMSSCHEIHVEDCPDLIHHWYDHFYCPRPCPRPGGIR